MNEAQALPVLSAAPAGVRHQRVALGVVLVSLVVFAALAPFAKLQLERMPAFVPLYQSALIFNDLVTAALIFAQCRFSRSRPVFVLGCGYLFTALMIVAHTLSFPGLLAPQGVLGGGPQTTAWLYMFWHAFFPVFVVLYALSGETRMTRPQMWTGVAATLAAALGFALLAGPGEALLPPIMSGNTYLPGYHAVVGFTWLCSAAGIAAVWRRRPRTVLDVWVMVVLCVWICEIALAAVLNQGRFDLGFYAGRVYGLLAATFLLGVLIWETTALHARAAQAHAERAAHAETQAASRAKDEFLAVLGHELRNPLAPIVTALQIMRLREPRALATERAIIERQVAHLKRLVDDLLDVSRLTRGIVEVRRVRCDAAQLAAQAAETAGPAIDAKRHRLELAVPQGLALDADPGRVVQALCNLLINAAKFTPEGGTIRLSAAREDGSIAFRVRDNGAGMAPELLARLFEPFAQGPQSYDRARGGLGLGLAIVRGIAALHGGSIDASSEGPGRGSEFVLRLPAGSGEPLAAAQPAGAAPAVPAPGMRVLVVDDNADAAVMLATLLRHEGMEVHVAHDGEQALELAPRARPQAALLDLGLPRMDGVELARRLIALPGLEGVRVAALTGYGTEADRARTAAAGFKAHFVKPAAAEAVLRFLRAGATAEAASGGR